MSSPIGNTPCCCSSVIYRLELLLEFLLAELLFVLEPEEVLSARLLFEFLLELLFVLLLELLFVLLLELVLELLPVLLPEFFFVDELLELVLVVLLLLVFLLSFPPQAVADTAIIATIPRIRPFFINPFIFFSVVFLFCMFFVLSFL